MNDQKRIMANFNLLMAVSIDQLKKMRVLNDISLCKCLKAYDERNVLIETAINKKEGGNFKTKETQNANISTAKAHALGEERGV